MKNFLAVLGVIAILAGSVYGYKCVAAARKRAQEKRAGKHEVELSVQTARVTRTRIDEVLIFNGDIQAMQTVDLQPKVSGRLLKLELENGTPIEEGTIVRKGQLIGKIDDRDLKAKVANVQAAKAAAEAAKAVAEASVVNATAGVTYAKATLTEKKREKERQILLLSKVATTQQNYDQAMTAFDQAEASLRQAEAELKRYQANVIATQAAIQQISASLDEATVNLSETNLYAPLDGVVSKKRIDPGSMVSSNTTIATIVDIRDVKVVISVPVNHLARLVPKVTTARIRTASIPEKAIDCTIEKIYPAVDLTTRTAQVEFRTKNFKDNNDDYRIKPGMYATVEVLIESRDNVLAVDSALPIRNLNRNLIYRLQPDGTVKAVNVKLGVRYNAQVEILSGLNEGDEIVVVGQHRLTDGVKVKVIPGNNLKM